MEIPLFMKHARARTRKKSHSLKTSTPNSSFLSIHPHAPALARIGF
jgi:hypothetical protein